MATIPIAPRAASQFSETATSTTPLSRAAEQVFARRYLESGDRHALRRLVESNQNFVIKIARQYLGNGLPLDDLISEGNIGLMEAARRFDPERGLKFITYAVWWIRRGILQALSDQSRVVRLPKYRLRQARLVRDRVEFLRQHRQREPSTSEVAADLKTSPREVEDLLAVGAFESPLEAATGSGAGPARGGGPGAHDIEESHYRGEVRRLLEQAIDRLPKRAQHVVRRRYALADDDCGTLEAISHELGLTKERVRQIEITARAQLREWFVDGDHAIRVDGCHLA